ncbi:MAG: hypothetical protein KC620_16655, partial [Myxococcales bacterium]|nr:hypothetical protein [Myxococcales bacterium]
AHVHRVVICFDAEASDAGLKGAEATADDLFDAGLPVSIATLPRPEEVAKVDLNEYLKAHGADALRAVLAAARPVIEHHLAVIPADTPAAELPRRLRPLLARLEGRTSIERDAAIDAVCARFKLQRRSVRTLLQRDAGAKSTASLRGAVHVEGGHYAAWLGPTPSAVSSFVLDLQERVVVEGGAELLLCALRCENGRRVDGLRLTAADFHSRQALLKALGVPDAQWTGSDEHAQGVLRLLTATPGPSRRGARVLGLATTPAGRRWVGPHAIIAADAIRADDPAIRFVGEDGALTRSLRVAATPDAELRALAAAALPALIALNEPAVMLPLLGWFHAAPLRAFVRERLGHFPLLVVWGTQGSGKTTLVCEVLWPLFGVEAALPFSANATEFTLLKLMASTNAVPVVLDEYKPSDMAQGRLAALHRLLRQGYTGELAQRGRSDQTVVDYALDAPVCLIGECRPIEPALLERMVSARPDKNAIATDPARREALLRLRALPFARLAGPYLRFALGQDVDTLLGVARRELARCLGERAIPLRVQDNLIALLVGLILFDRFAADCGAPLPAPDFALAIRAVLADVLDGDGQVKSGLDHFLEQLAAAAVNGMAMPSRHYLRDEDTLYVHLASAHAVYREHCRRTAWRGEVIDENALRRQAREELERGGYVLAVSHQVIFGQRLDRRRVLVIDLERARRSLDVDGFAASESQNPLDSRPRESLHGPASATLAGRAYHDGEMP